MTWPDRIGKGKERNQMSAVPHDRMLDNPGGGVEGRAVHMEKQREAGTVDEIIEERDREGRVVKNRYIKSKLLGKVLNT